MVAISMALSAEPIGIGRTLARPEGLEPPAYRFEVCRSIQLSYGRAPFAL
jgi:hypothetical protein